MELATISGGEELPRITHLNGRIEEFLHYVKTRMNRSQRIQAFFQSAQTVSVILVVFLSLLVYLAFADAFMGDVECMSWSSNNCSNLAKF